MNKLSKKITNFVKIPLREQLLFLEGILTNLSAKFLIKFIPLRYTVKLYGEKGKEDYSVIETESDRKIFSMVKRSFNRVIREVPWKTKCYDQALTYKWLLGRRGLKATIYFGVAKGKESKLNAHAWLKFNNRIINGGEVKEKYTIVNYFS